MGSGDSDFESLHWSGKWFTCGTIALALFLVFKIILQHSSFPCGIFTCFWFWLTISLIHSHILTSYSHLNPSSIPTSPSYHTCSTPFHIPFLKILLFFSPPNLMGPFLVFWLHTHSLRHTHTYKNWKLGYTYICEIACSFNLHFLDG